MMVTYMMLFILSIFVPVTVSAQCILTPDSENVVGTQLAGDWQINGDLTVQLWPDFTPMEVTAVSFTNNPSIVDCESWMNDFGPLFMVGEITFAMEEDLVTYPYVLSSIHGNPNILVWVELGLVESFNVMLARAEEKNNDILFIEVDGYNEPFTAWTRMKI